MVYGQTFKEPDTGRYLKPDEVDHRGEMHAFALLNACVALLEVWD